MVALEDVATVTAGNPAPQRAEFFESGDRPFVRVQDLGRLNGATHLNQTADLVNDRAARSLKLFPKGSVLFTKSGASLLLHQRAIPGRDMHVVSHVGVAVPGHRVTSEWLYYWLRQIDFANIAHGANMPSLQLSRVKQIQVPVPPVEEQYLRVAEIEKQFSRLDEAVANLKRIKVNLDRHKAAVLTAAVEGRLVPTETELAHREGRSFESGEQLLERMLVERRSAWDTKAVATGRNRKYIEPRPPEAANLPVLAKGWAWATLGQLAWSVRDGPHYSPKYVDQGIPFITGGQVRPEGIDFSTAKFISLELHCEFSRRCKPELGDMLYTKGGTTGIARVNTDSREFNVWVHVAVLKLVPSIHRFYLQHALNSPHCFRQARRYTHGVGNQDLGLTRMVWITVPIPPFAEQERIVSEIDRRLSITVEIEREIRTKLQRAEQLRHAILVSAFREDLGARLVS